VPGKGDVGLSTIYRLLREKAPHPDDLVMELEIDPVPDEKGGWRDRREVLREAVAFVKSL
jgi:sugar phosphate isomerase/epimerase